MRKKKRKFVELRAQILRELKKGERTINELAKATKTNWRTVDNHITYLIGKGKVVPVLQTKYVRIYKLAEVEK
ncbi:hypothetical protein B6U93_00620 [Candidatus Woesearchaeota archaeon ex4484_78]|nr:MAG: hypothetical protein B6U93_00620 [Candidatus Woesearchaeota archaeon ex4484_78]